MRWEGSWSSNESENWNLKVMSADLSAIKVIAIILIKYFIVAFLGI